MKKIFLSISILGLLLTSCEEFLTREPYNAISSDEFFASENDLVTYANGLIQYMMPSAENLTWDYNNFADYLAVSSVQPFLRTGWDFTKQTGWSNPDWRNLYRINYFLVNMGKAAPKISDPSVIKHYEGEIGRAHV